MRPGRRPRKRRIRAFKDGTAADAIGQLEPGCEIYTLTFGQFSLIDAICALLEQTGPADVTLSTWSAAAADLERAAALLERSSIRSLPAMLQRYRRSAPSTAVSALPKGVCWRRCWLLSKATPTGCCCQTSLPSRLRNGCSDTYCAQKSPCGHQMMLWPCLVSPVRERQRLWLPPCCAGAAAIRDQAV